MNSELSRSRNVQTSMGLPTILRNEKEQQPYESEDTRPIDNIPRFDSQNYIYHS